MACCDGWECDKSEINEILAADADYVVWSESLEQEHEDEGYTTWLHRQEQLLNASEECTALVEF